jgi:microcystin-dependent protein
MAIWQWSTTAGSNDSADASINLREGQAPSTLNNAVRAIMAALKAWWLDLGGMLDTAGTSTAFTLTTNQNISTLTDGACVSARMHATNGASATLAVDGTAAKSITTAPSTPASSGMLLIGSVHTFVYDAGNDEWRLKGVFVPDGVAKTGDLKVKATSTTDAGWVLAAKGHTIGNASSGATRANADTEALFLQLWSDYSNTLLPILDSSGSASTRGATASADYAANKRMPVPEINGRVLAALDNLGGTSANTVTNSSADTLGGTLGAETHTLQTSEIPAHSHGVTDPGHTHTGTVANVWGPASGESASPGGGRNLDSRSFTTSNNTTGISINNAGGGGSHNNMQPTFFGYVFIKL